MTRSLKKGPYVDAKILEKMKKLGKSRDPIKTWARSCTVIPDMVGWSFLIHNGRQHLKVYITEDMVGHKFGEFSPTRVFRGHTTRKAEEVAPGAPAAPAGKAGKA